VASAAHELLSQVEAQEKKSIIGAKYPETVC